MNTYISILRGINVSGQKKIKMVNLKSHYEKLGYTNVITYIQSGNVIFESNEEPNTCVDNITQKIEEEYGFHVPVIIRNKQELELVVENDLFITKRGEDEAKLHVTFLGKEVNPEVVLSIQREKYLPDEFILHGKEVYLFTPNGYGRTKLNNNFFERKLKVSATTRNLKTVNKLIELSS